MLYHAILPENHVHYISIDEVLKNGISNLTKSNYWYGNGGEVKQNLTNQLRPSDIPIWVDFKKAIGINLHPHKPRSFCFPEFTEKILVFDGDITMSIYDQAFYEDLKDSDEEALNFDTGETLEKWVKLYWESLMTLDDYKTKKPYPKPEILVFESIPKDIIQVCE